MTIFYYNKKKEKGQELDYIYQKIIIENNMNGKLGKWKMMIKGAVLLIRLNESLEEDMNRKKKKNF